MVDGFHWTRVTSKQLRFLYEAVTLIPAPAHMYELAARIDGAPDGAAARDQMGTAPGLDLSTPPPGAPLDASRK